MDAQTKVRNRGYRWMVRGLAVALLAVALPAWAAGYGRVMTSIYLRAGPRVGYPVVALLYPGSSVFVHGCLSDYAWCDVTFEGERGWVDAAYLDYAYRGEFLPVMTYGPSLGIAIFSFSIGDYWGRYYPHRSWYRDRHAFDQRFGPGGQRGQRAPRERFRPLPRLRHQPRRRTEAPRPAPGRAAAPARNRQPQKKRPGGGP